MKSSRQQEFNEVDEVCGVNTQVPRFPIPGCGMTFNTWLELKSAVLFTHPLLETEAALKTNEIQILELKKMLPYLFHSKEAGLLRSKEVPGIPEQDLARVREEPQSCLLPGFPSLLYASLYHQVKKITPAKCILVGQEKQSQALKLNKTWETHSCWRPALQAWAGCERKGRNRQTRPLPPGTYGPTRKTRPTIMRDCVTVCN